MTKRILVTGGAGYIGSHTTLELLQAGYEVAVLDNLSNSSRASLDRVAEICGQEARFHEADILDPAALDRVFDSQPFDAVVHFAALKAVGESTAEPLRYYENNVTGTIELLAAMGRHGVKRIVFSSSATVYGDAPEAPFSETLPLAPINPYGRTKVMVEDILRDLALADPEWNVFLLRYFNPVGAHPSGKIGEDPRGIPNNLMPFVMQVAVGARSHVNVFGDDYPTEDGTGVRDYIHVVDLALGHVAALKKLSSSAGCMAINLGTGRGHSVLEVLAAAERAAGRPIPREVIGRRAGDGACAYADPALAEQVLGWTATRGLDEMAADHWRWQSANPRGYEG